MSRQFPLEEASRWKKEMTRGKLGLGSIRELRTKGIAKSPAQLASGIERGTDNLLKKKAPHVTEKNSKLALLTGGGFITQPSRGIFDFLRKTPTKGKSTLWTIKTPGKFALRSNPFYIRDTEASSGKLSDENKLAQAIIRRHEATEAIYQKKLQDKFKMNRPPILANFAGKNHFGEEFPVGNHYTAKVLRDEAKLVNSMRHTRAARNFRITRSLTGEDGLLNRIYGVPYTEIGYHNSGKIGKLIDKYETEVYNRRKNESIPKKIARHILSQKSYYPPVDTSPHTKMIQTIGSAIRKGSYLSGLRGLL